MVYLKLFKATKSIGKNIEVMEFESLEAAVRSGRQSGFAYLIDDRLSGKTYDGEEFESGDEEEWYYDEPEMIWKRKPGGSVLKRMLSIAIPIRDCFPSKPAGYQVCAG
jgi:hypothetical protein